MQAQASQQAARLPAVTVTSMADVVHFSVEQEMLRAQCLLQRTPRAAHLTFPNPAQITILQTLPAIRRGPEAPPLGFVISSRDFSHGDAMCVFTTISCTLGRVEVSRDFETARVLGSVQLIEDGPQSPLGAANAQNPVRLFVHRINELTQQEEVKLKLTAPTFSALVQAHPAECEQYLRPIFRELDQESAVFAPTLTAAWQVLADDVTPDPTVAARVEAALTELDSDDFQRREAASHALRKLGEPAALVLMKRDRKKLSLAQSSAVDTFLAGYLPLSPPAARQLGGDIGFLLDTQYCDSPQLRTLAAERMKKLLGRPDGIDPLAPDATRLAQVARARAALLGAPPATSPGW
jgi:hypothetical protein